MYQVYIKSESSLTKKELIGEYREFDKACERAEAAVAKDENVEYIIEETTGAVDGLGELIATVVKAN